MIDTGGYPPPKPLNARGTPFRKGRMAARTWNANCAGSVNQAHNFAKIERQFSTRARFLGVSVYRQCYNLLASGCSSRELTNRYSTTEGREIEGEKG